MPWMFNLEIKTINLPLIHNCNYFKWSCRDGGMVIAPPLGEKKKDSYC